jgi:hypothetical protein
MAISVIRSSPGRLPVVSMSTTAYKAAEGFGRIASYFSEATKGGEKFKVNWLQLNNNIFYRNIDSDVIFDFLCYVRNFAGPSIRPSRTANLNQNSFFIQL